MACPNVETSEEDLTKFVNTEMEGPIFEDVLVNAGEQIGRNLTVNFTNPECYGKTEYDILIDRI